MQVAAQLYEIPRISVALTGDVTVHKSVETPTTCPCCGSVKGTRLPIVDLNTNTVAWGDKATKLTPIGAELMTLFVKAYPGMVTRSRLIERVWGDADPPLTAESALNVHIHQLRKVLRPMGWGVRVVWGDGYRLEKVA